MSKLHEWLFEKYGSYTIVFAIVSSICIWGFAHWAAAPGSDVSTLWGLAKYKKKDIPPAPKPHVQIATPSTDAEIAAAIRQEALVLLKRTGSTPRGLWLMAEATTNSKNELFYLADQLPPEDRAEALAYVPYALTVFNRPKDALCVAERSLAAVDDIQEQMRWFSLIDLVKKFSEAKLSSPALKAAEQALAFAKKSDKETDLSTLVRYLVRISSLSHALTVAREIEDPKNKSEALAMIGDELIKQGKNKEAKQVFQDAISASHKIAKTSDRASAIANRAREQCRLGRYDESIMLAKQAKDEAVKINPNELFGELTAKITISEMSLYEYPRQEILRLATIHKKPDLIVRMARNMPKKSAETAKFIKTAEKVAIEIQNPYILADIAKLLKDTGSPDKSVKLAKLATKIALRSSNPRTRDLTLQTTSVIFADSGDFKEAFTAVEGIDNIKDNAESMTKVLCNYYVQNGKPDEKISKILSRTYKASDSLQDKERSEVLMYLAVSHALLGNFAEAYQIGKQAPFSAHRLAAYSVIILGYELQRSPDLEKQIMIGSVKNLSHFLL